MTEDVERVHETVRERYANFARTSSSCCDGGRLLRPDQPGICTRWTC